MPPTILTQAQATRKRLLPGVRHIVAVASGKGGVGKSTVSVNLALALQKSGLRVGILDADVYGPSVPTLLGLKDKPVSDGARIRPVERFGIRAISTGFFFPTNEAVIWRGPMLHKMIQDLLTVVDWGELDYLLVDLPPGTGDVQISLCQTIPMSGAVIVSTPQDVAWNVAQKAISMFIKLGTPVLGVIENMSTFVCSHCGNKEEIFGSGGARRAAEEMKIPFLGEVPLESIVRQFSDSGEPIVVSSPASNASMAFFSIAERLAQEIAKKDEDGPERPTPSKFGPAGLDTIDVEWSDGTKKSFPARGLRLLCPCAGCVDEVSGKRTLDPNRVAADVKALEFYPVGNYALQIRWSDGHSTGLYTYEFLQRLK